MSCVVMASVSDAGPGSNRSANLSAWWSRYDCTAYRPAFRGARQPSSRAALRLGIPSESEVQFPGSAVGEVRESPCHAEAAGGRPTGVVAAGPVRIAGDRMDLRGLGAD